MTTPRTTTSQRPQSTIEDIHGTAPLDPDELLRFREAAACDDRANEFFASTHDALLAAGHYRATLPVELGGGGLDLARTARRQRELARFAPAPALASTMHLYWTGAAADLSALEVPALELVLRDAADGQIFASGHAETGNDVPIALSTTVAEPVDGGYRITGRKHFGSLGPVWDHIGFHAIDHSDPNDPRIVHGFAARDAAGVTVVENWDTTTMRASQSHDIVLDSVFVPTDRIAVVVPASPAESPVIGAMTVWALTLLCNVYLGVAERAFELAVHSSQTKTSIGLGGRTMAHNPMIQGQIADMWIALDGARATLDQLAHDWVNGVEHGPLWAPKVFAAKQRTAHVVRSVVDTAADVVGGSSIRNDNEMSRLWRDARGITFHPANHAFAHEAIGKAMLGLDPNGPRW